MIKIIAGCPHSGTSLVAGILRYNGANFGDIKNRPLGRAKYDRHEHGGLIKICNKHYHWFNLPETCFAAHKELERFFRESLARGVDTFKCNQIFPMLPVIMELFPDTKLVFVRRNTGALIDALIYYKGAINNRQYARKLIKMFKAHMAVWPYAYRIDFENLFHTQYAHIHAKSLVDWCELDYKEDTLEKCVKKEIRRK